MPAPPLPRRIAPRREYRLYIDENGSHGRPRADDAGENRYLCLIGCVIPRDTYISTFDPALAELKRRYFGTDEVNLHKMDIDKRHGQFAVLADQVTRHSFNCDMVSLYRQTEFAVISVTIDKVLHYERHGGSAWHPYHYCAELMMERYCFYLGGVGGVGDAAAESRNPTDDAKLAARWNECYENGTGYIRDGQQKTVLMNGFLQFKTKRDNIPGLQLADMLASTTKEDTLIANGRRRLFRDRGDMYVAAAIECKYHRRGDQINGCGRVLLE